MASRTSKTETKKSSESTAKKGEHNKAQEDKKSQQSSSDDSSEEMDAGEELDNLLTLWEEEDLTDMDLEQAVDVIDDWHGILNQSKDAELKEIGNNLKQLKKLLGASEIKDADLAEAMSSLGSQVAQFANKAERGYKTKLHQLGKALSGEGKELMRTQPEEE